MADRRTTLIVLCLLASLVACRGDEEPDAYGNVEAVDVIVGAEMTGRLETFQPREGDELSAGAIVGSIETTSVALEGRQVVAQRDAAASRLAEIAAQIDALEVQRRIAQRSYERTRRLFEQRAATAQNLDQTEREYRVLGEQIETARAQAGTIRKEVESIEAQVERVAERIEKGQIVNPIDGTVLATYARAGEVTQAGQPLYRVASLDTMEVRAYITETQLSSVQTGQRVEVTIDVGTDERRTIPGTLSWISSDAEFTPTPIQTREERADLVYAIKIRVPNPERILKIGMPADVDW